MLRLLLCYLLFALAPALTAQEDMTTVRDRVLGELLALPYDAASADAYAKSLRADGTWADINYTDISRTGFEHREHLSRLLEMTLAFRHAGTSRRGAERLLPAIQRGLRYWIAKDYRSDNWWYNQVFVPRTLAQISMLLVEDLTPAILAGLEPIVGRAHLLATGARPGGDRMKIGATLALATLRKGDAAAFRAVIDTLSAQVKFTTGDRGIQADYSFHHRVDRVNNTVSYGKGYAENFAEWAAYVAGTSFAFAEPAVRRLVDYYLDGIVRQQVYGMYPDAGVLNRSNSRPKTFAPAGTEIATDLLAATAYRADELRQLIALRSGRAKPTASFCRFFWQTEHFVCQRPEWYASVRMHSVRNANMEVPYNEEGFYNHHRGDGTNHLHLRGDEYLNVWPVYDYQKIPGTTIRQKDTLDPNDVQRYGLSNFVGAMTDGQYGAVGYDFISPHDGTKARKAWFFFADEYLCLGAGIESLDRRQSVVTTLDQRRRNGPVTVGNTSGSRLLAEDRLSNEPVSWVHHDGVGYRFAQAQTGIHLEAATREGRWTDINHQWTSPREPVTVDMFQLWVDHGPRPHGRPGGLNHAATQPKDVTYAYTVIPNVSADEMATRKPAVQIIENSRWVQAVNHPTLGLTQVVAYRGTTLDLDTTTTLSLDGPGALMLQRDGTGRITQVTVADPGRRTAAFHFSVSGKYHGSSSVHSTVYEAGTDRTHFRVRMPGEDLAGSSVILKIP